jgi:hypothetical protein
MNRRSNREVLLEFTRVGRYIRATAMDPETLTEVSVMGPVGGSQELLKRTVMAKLDYVLAKKASGTMR